MKCVVTGSSGYLGSKLAAELRRNGYEVVALSRRLGNFSLESDVPLELIGGADVLIHCAYDFSLTQWSDISRVNINGTVNLFDKALEGGIGRGILISTLSAFRGCLSLYGRAKLEIESRIARKLPRTYVVRPGLVYDEKPGGMMGALARAAGGFPVIPLVDNGNQLLYLAHSEDISRLIVTLCTTADAVAGPIVAACDEGITFRDLLTGLASGRKLRFFNIPRAPLIALLRVLERLGWRSRMRTDSFISLLNQSEHVDFLNTRQLGVSFRRYRGRF